MGKKEEKKVVGEVVQAAEDEEMSPKDRDLVDRYLEDIAERAKARRARDENLVDEETLALVAFGGAACFAATEIEELCVGVEHPEEHIADIVIGLGLRKLGDDGQYAFHDPLMEEALQIALDNVLVRGNIANVPLAAESGAQALELLYRSISPTPDSRAVVLHHPLENAVNPALSFPPLQAVSGRERIRG